MIKEVKAYQSSDGRVFRTKGRALLYENERALRERLQTLLGFMYEDGQTPSLDHLTGALTAGADDIFNFYRIYFRQKESITQVLNQEQRMQNAQNANVQRVQGVQHVQGVQPAQHAQPVQGVQSEQEEQ